MPPCPWSLEIIDICKSRNDLDIGIHLTLTSEYNFYKWRPMSGPNINTGLVDSNGYFWSTDPEVEKNREHNIMTGEVPSPINPPSGCVFHPRCSLAVESCKSDIPVLEDKRAGHFVACTQV